MRRGFSKTLLIGVFQIYLRQCTASTHIGTIRFCREEYGALEHLAVPFLIIFRFHILHTAFILIDTGVSLFSRSGRGGQVVMLYP